jgi:hypothetical protein
MVNSSLVFLSPKAIELNQRYSYSLGWMEHIDQIAELLGFKNQSPDFQRFVYAIAEWQQAHCLNVDGILDKKTWIIMKPLLPPKKIMKGCPSNRGLKYGMDGPIPNKYRPKIEKAILLAYDLGNLPKFVADFRQVVSILTWGPKTKVTQNIYWDTLNKAEINFAETSKTPPVIKEIKRADLYDKGNRAGAFAIINGKKIWIREFFLERADSKAIAGILMHEAAHLAGANWDQLAESALEKLSQVSGYPRMGEWNLPKSNHR